jgi:hypothetical protein
MPLQQHDGNGGERRRNADGAVTEHHLERQ